MLQEEREKIRALRAMWAETSRTLVYAVMIPVLSLFGVQNNAWARFVIIGILFVLVLRTLREQKAFVKALEAEERALEARRLLGGIDA